MLQEKHGLQETGSPAPHCSPLLFWPKSLGCSENALTCEMETMTPTPGCQGQDTGCGQWMASTGHGSKEVGATCAEGSS